MPIRAFLQDEAFGPTEIEAMSWALEAVCHSLHVSDDKSREVIAVRIIELAQRGVRSGIALRDRILREADLTPLLESEAPLIPWHQQQRF